jgi:hypothetical protein
MNDNENDNEAALPDTPGGLPQEKVEDRPRVGQVSPDDYPEPASGSDPVGESPGRSGQNYDPKGSSAGASGGGEANDN